MKIRPISNRVLVKRMDEDDKTAGGLYIPDTAKEKPVRGKVIAVGSGKILKDGSTRQVELKTGDTVLFTKYGGTEVKVEGDDHLIMNEDDVLAVVE